MIGKVGTYEVLKPQTWPCLKISGPDSKERVFFGLKI